MILADQSQSNHSQEDDTFAEDSIGQSSGVIHQLRRSRLVSESEDYTNVSYDLYAMSVRSLLILLCICMIERVLHTNDC